MCQRLVVQICDPYVDLEIVERALNLLGGLGQHAEGDVRVAGMKWCGKAWDHGQCGGDRPDAQMAHQSLAHLAHFLVQAVAVGQDALRPIDDADTLGRESFEALAALDDGDGELGLELLDRRGKGWLGNAASRCGAAKMPFAGEGAKIDQLAKKHGRILASVPVTGKRH
jgi:hypothetical protein